MQRNYCATVFSVLFLFVSPPSWTDALAATPSVSTVQVAIEGEITNTTALKILTAASSVPKVLNITIDSPGGESQAAIIISKTLAAIRRGGTQVNCLVTNKAASAAFFILQACTFRIAAPNATLMIHEPLIIYAGPTPVGITLQTVRKLYEKLTEDSETLAAVIAPRLGISIKEYHNKIEDDWTMTPDQALANHAIDRISP